MGSLKNIDVDSRDEYYESLPFLNWETPQQRSLVGPHESSELFMHTGPGGPYKIASVQDRDFTRGDTDKTYRLDFRGTVLEPYLKTQRFPEDGPLIYRPAFVGALVPNKFATVEEAKKTAERIASEIITENLPKGNAK